MILERRKAKFKADKARTKAKHEKRMAEFSVGETVEYFGAFEPLANSNGNAVITHIGWLSGEPVCWLAGGNGAWSLYAVRKLEPTR